MPPPPAEPGPTGCQPSPGGRVAVGVGVLAGRVAGGVAVAGVVGVGVALVWVTVAVVGRVAVGVGWLPGVR